MNTTQRLMRSRTDTMIAGVAGGLAQYFGIDPVIVRLAFVLLLFSGPGAPIYLIMAMIMPQAPATEPPAAPLATPTMVAYDDEIPINNVGSASAAPSSDNRNRTLGMILLGVGAFLMIQTASPGLLSLLFPLLLIGAGVWLVRKGN